jgi:hypothetical protein
MASAHGPDVPEQFPQCRSGQRHALPTAAHPRKLAVVTGCARLTPARTALAAHRTALALFRWDVVILEFAVGKSVLGAAKTAPYQSKHLMNFG